MESRTHPTELLTDLEVAGALKMSRQTLANWRSDGRGPRFVKIGPRIVRYHRADLEAWIEEQGQS
jgi:predicted DNA-binding transcriptional regulator AlpA